MKNYDPNIWDGIHTIKVTIQQWDYVGHIYKEIGGNCKGRDILGFDFDCEDDDMENDCQLSFDEEFECFYAVLSRENGDTLEVYGDSYDFNNMIVAIEILEYKMRGTDQPENE